MNGRAWAIAVAAALVCAVAIDGQAQAAGPAKGQRGSWDHRDFNGMWLLAGSGLDEPGKDDPNIGLNGKPTDLSDDWGFDTRPVLKGAYKQEYERRRQADIDAGRDFMVTCKPNGMPALTAGPYGNEILQNERQINWYQEFPGEMWRIYLDGRPHPDPNQYPATLSGHSTGRWEGDTLVVDTVHIRTDTLLFGQGRSEKGLGHGSKMHIVQRIKLLDADHLRISGTVEDPEALEQPWHYTLTYHRHPGQEVIEYLCDDNNRESLDPTTGREITDIPPRRNLPADKPKK